MENLKLKKKNNILIVAAHPDDEILGCGGTIIRLRKEFNIYTIFMTDGVSSRGKNKKEAQLRRKSCLKLFSHLKINKPFFLNFPDNKLDSVPLLNIVKKIEKILFRYNPIEVYTHFENCLNIDHRITYQATITACRPLKSSNVSKILSFEIPSSSDWALFKNKSFQPNYFVDITKELPAKINSLKFYKKEIKKDPHSRSLNYVKALAKVRGGSCGVKFAEGFYLNRFIQK